MALMLLIQLISPVRVLSTNLGARGHEGREVAGSRGGLSERVRAASGHLTTGFLAYPQHSTDYVRTPGSTELVWRASMAGSALLLLAPPTRNHHAAKGRHR